jgi:hypothetical protein
VKATNKKATAAGTLPDPSPALPGTVESRSDEEANQTMAPVDTTKSVALSQAVRRNPASTMAVTRATARMGISGPSVWR